MPPSLHVNALAHQDSYVLQDDATHVYPHQRGAQGRKLHEGLEG